VDVQADAPAGGFLVLTDPYYPGWHAFVDGQEAPILRADYLFRAVALGPGSHLVRFAFTPTSFERGIWMSLAGVGVALGAILVGLVGLAIRRKPWGRPRVGRASDSAIVDRSTAAPMHHEAEASRPDSSSGQGSVAPEDHP
jgi:hypothetical protein